LEAAFFDANETDHFPFRWGSARGREARDAAHPPE